VFLKPVDEHSSSWQGFTRFYRFRGQHRYHSIWPAARLSTCLWSWSAATAVASAPPGRAFPSAAGIGNAGAQHEPLRLAPLRRGSSTFSCLAPPSSFSVSSSSYASSTSPSTSSPLPYLTSSPFHLALPLLLFLLLCANLKFPQHGSSPLRRAVGWRPTQL
jgi:hypothetical protein